MPASTSQFGGFDSGFMIPLGGALFERLDGGKVTIEDVEAL